MTLFIGYDPGGRGAHGVAAARIARDGSFQEEPELAVLPTAVEVRGWLQSRRGAKALGIDTLLAWSLNGGRACDHALRSRYPEQSGCVVAQNSLFSSMTINGAMIAQEGQKLGLFLIESHPKLLIRTGVGGDREAGELVARYRKLTDNDFAKSKAKRADDKADARVAAWCASRWWHKRWTTDLFSIDDELRFPACRAAYPWPEPIC